MNFVLGLDLGQQRDPSAIVISERVQVWDGSFRYQALTGDKVRHLQDEYHVRHVERLPLKTPYPQVVDRVCELAESPSLIERTIVAFDRTGVGGGIADMFGEAYRDGRLSYRPEGYTLTGGHESQGRSITKVDLVSRLQALLANGRLKFAAKLKFGEELQAELMAFRAKVTGPGSATFEARTGAHDDLVVALGLSVWRRHTRSEPRLFVEDPRGGRVEWEERVPREQIRIGPTFGRSQK